MPAAPGMQAPDTALLTVLVQLLSGLGLLGLGLGPCWLGRHCQYHSLMNVQVEPWAQQVPGSAALAVLGADLPPHCCHR